MFCGKRFRDEVGHHAHEFMAPMGSINNRRNKVICTHTGFNAAACTLTRTCPFFNFEGTGKSVLNTSASLGTPFFAITQAFCVLGVMMVEVERRARQHGFYNRSSWSLEDRILERICDQTDLGTRATGISHVKSLRNRGPFISRTNWIQSGFDTVSKKEWIHIK